MSTSNLSHILFDKEARKHMLEKWWYENWIYPFEPYFSLCIKSNPDWIMEISMKLEALTLLEFYML